MIELSGTEGKLEAFIELARPYGIVELARTGVIAMPRGAGGARKPGLNKSTATRSDTGRQPDIDPGDLPPG